MTMQDSDNEQREFEQLLKDAPMGYEAPDALKRKLRSYIGFSRVRKIRRWIPRALVMGGSAAAVFAAALFLWPTSASAKSFQRVLDATNQARTFTISLDEGGGGSRKLVRLAGVDGLLDISTDGGEHAQIDKGKMSVYDPKANTLMVVKFGNSAEMGFIGSGLQEGLREGIKFVDVKKMLADFKAHYGEENAKVSDTFTEDGRKVYTMDLQSPRDSSRATITVDADTSLPVRIQAVEQSHKSVDLRIAFGGDVRIQPIEETLPKDVKRNERDFGKIMEQAGRFAGQAKAFGDNAKAFGEGMKHFGESMGK